MSNLRTLLYTVPLGRSEIFPAEILVYHTNVTAQQNGGRCCAFTAPPGTTFINFEMWGGGGSGGGACCCMTGQPGGAGAYTIKGVTGVLGGCVYTVCAASSNISSNTNAGCPGCTSYVTGAGLTNFCAAGGTPGCNDCFRFCLCYTCSIIACTGVQACGGDLNMQVMCGGNIQGVTVCSQWGQQLIPLAAATASGPMIGPNGCHNCGWTETPGTYQCAYFPGGGGAGAQAMGGSCWCSVPGAGGLVSITYG